MSNLQKNHVKIDVFNEPKYRFDPNQVHSSSFHPHKTPKKQKNIIFGTYFFWSKCLRPLYRHPSPSTINKVITLAVNALAGADPGFGTIAVFFMFYLLREILLFRLFCDKKITRIISRVHYDENYTKASGRRQLQLQFRF